jgi:hypothetical protein
MDRGGMERQLRTAAEETSSNRSVSLFFSNIIMSNSTLFTLGSIHLGHKRLSDVSRGRQCSFMSFSALLCAQS